MGAKKKRPKKSEFIAAKLAKGCSKKQAEHDWALSVVLRRFYRRLGRQGRQNRRRRGGTVRMADRRRHQAKLRRLLGYDRKLDRPKAEAVVREHYRKLGMRIRDIVWVGGPGEAEQPAPRSPKYLSLARTRNLFSPWSFRGRGASHHLNVLDWMCRDCETDPPELSPVEDTFELRRGAWRARRRARAGRPAVAMTHVLPVAMCLLGTNRLAKQLLEAAPAGLFGFWPLKQGRVVCLPAPKLTRERGQLHCADGPAVLWPNGETGYFWRGMAVPEDVIMAPESLSAERIDRGRNAEVRRVMVERFGAERYLQVGGAIKIDESEHGILWAKPQLGDDPIVVVEVVNHTPEPDGSFRHYFLPVPPWCTSATEAVAWTWRLRKDQFQPLRAT